MTRRHRHRGVLERTRRLWQRRRLSKRERLAITACITAASIAAAVGAWRTETYANRGDELDREGFAQQVAFERELASARAANVDTIARYAQERTAAAESVALRREALQASAADASRLRTEAASLAHQAAAIRLGMDPDAFQRGRVTASSLFAKVSKGVLFDSTQEDFLPSDEFHASDRDLRTADYDTGFAALAIVAALLLTLAQVLHRRVFLMGGGLMLATTVALLALFEVRA